MKEKIQRAIRLGSFCMALLMSLNIQAQSFNAGKSAVILGNLNGSNKMAAANTIQISSKKTLVLDINVSKSVKGTATIIGNIVNETNSVFFLNGDATNLKGNFILKDKKEAYSFSTDKNGEAYITPIDINKVLCIEYHDAPTNSQQEAAPSPSASVTDLQSLPGAEAVVLLDFDGQVVSGTYWNGGNTINAAPSGFGNNTMQEIWELISEDYRPFALNITTSEAIYQAAPANKRMRCIFTPTNTAAPGSGGVAYIGSFSWGNETPCWVFNGGVKGAGEAGSHEVGHTLGLLHDGRINPSETYYAGNGNWAPIMGVGYYVGMVQFSKGEYPSANNQEDDINIIVSNNGFTFRNDDYSNFPASATPLDPDHDGTATISGIIEKQSDQDVFSFQTSGGVLNLYASSPSLQPDLDISLTLTDASGTIIQTNSPDGSISASLSLINLPAGTYYVYVDGVGKPSVNTNGYSDYSSLGSYELVGQVPPFSHTNQAPTIVITNPTEGQHFAFNTPFTISGTANDVDGSITKIEVYDNATLISTVNNSSTFSFAYTPPTVGNHRLSAIAYDNGVPVLFTVSAPVNIIVDEDNSGICTGTAVNGDYTYEVGKINGVSTIKFIPGSPITGCNAALIYYKVDNGPILGSYMEASGSNYVKTYSAPAGSIVTFYFTYRIGNTSNERNSSANPHSFIEGNCNGVINNPSGCTGGVANGDYTFEASSSNGITSIKFVPGAPIAGCNMALIYYKIDNGGLAGYYMDATGSNFTKSFSAPTGSTITFYFTYRVGTSGAERNSSATPHSFIVGNCGANAMAGEATNIENITANQNVVIYPNPAQDYANIQIANATFTTVEITDLFNRVISQYQITNDNGTLKINLNNLENGMYFVRLRTGNNEIVKSLVVKN